MDLKKKSQMIASVLNLPQFFGRQLENNEGSLKNGSGPAFFKISVDPNRILITQNPVLFFKSTLKLGFYTKPMLNIFVIPAYKVYMIKNPNRI